MSVLVRANTLVYVYVPISLDKLSQEMILSRCATPRIFIETNIAHCNKGNLKSVDI